MRFLSFSILAQVLFLESRVDLQSLTNQNALRSGNLSLPGDCIIEYIFGFLDYTGISQTQNYM